jgi:hypothetical protein
VAIFKFLATRRGGMCRAFIVMRDDEQRSRPSCVRASAARPYGWVGFLHVAVRGKKFLLVRRSPIEWDEGGWLFLFKERANE